MSAIEGLTRGGQGKTFAPKMRTMEVLIPIGIAVFVVVFMFSLAMISRRGSRSHRGSDRDFPLLNPDVFDASRNSETATPDQHSQHHHHHNAPHHTPSMPDTGAQHHSGGFDGGAAHSGGFDAGSHHSH
jgi:hypothetical protein